MDYKAFYLATFVTAISFSSAEIVVNDYLSLEGFADMSYSHVEQEFGAADVSDNSHGIDQVEIDFIFEYGSFTGQIDLECKVTDRYESNNAIEQAFLSYHKGDSKFTAGRFASQLGFEAFEPTGLYQYSFAYHLSDGVPLSALNNINGGVLPRYDQGVKYTTATATSYFGIALVESIDPSPANGSDSQSIELAGSLFLDHGFSVFAGARRNNYEAPDSDEIILNAYLTYQTGALVFAAELVSGERGVPGGSDIETLQALLMANYSYSDVASLSGRLSMVDRDIGGISEDFTKYTLAHGYALEENLFLVNELNLVNGQEGGEDYESLTIAAELIFTF